MYTYHRREIIRELEDDDKNWIKNKSAASGLHLPHIRQDCRQGVPIYGSDTPST